jgi:hypothetical protein
MEMVGMVCSIFLGTSGKRGKERILLGFDG